MIHVCSLSRLHKTVEDTGAQHIVTLLKDVDLVRRPDTIAPANHLVLGMDDIIEPLTGYVAPADDHARAALMAAVVTKLQSAIDDQGLGFAIEANLVMARR